MGWLYQWIELNMKFDKDKCKVYIQADLFVEGEKYMNLSG